MIFFSSKLLDKPIFRQYAQSTKCHFDEVTFRRNGSLDEVSFDEVSHFEKYAIFAISDDFTFCYGVSILSAACSKENDSVIHLSWR